MWCFGSFSLSYSIVAFSAHWFSFQAQTSIFWFSQSTPLNLFSLLSCKRQQKSKTNKHLWIIHSKLSIISQNNINIVMLILTLIKNGNNSKQSSFQDFNDIVYLHYIQLGLKCYDAFSNYTCVFSGISGFRLQTSITALQWPQKCLFMFSILEMHCDETQLNT